MYRCVLQNHLDSNTSLIFEADTEMEFWTASDWLESRGFFENKDVLLEGPEVQTDVVIETVTTKPATRSVGVARVRVDLNEPKEGRWHWRAKVNIDGKRKHVWQGWATEQEMISKVTAAIRDKFPEKVQNEIDFLCVNRTGQFALTRIADGKKKRSVLNRILRSTYANKWRSSITEARNVIKDAARSVIFKRVRTDEGFKYYWVTSQESPVLLGVKLGAKSKNYVRNMDLPAIRGTISVRGLDRVEYDLACYLCGERLVLKGNRHGGIFYGCTQWEKNRCKGATNALSSGIPDMQQYEENKQNSHT